MTETVQKYRVGPANVQRLNAPNRDFVDILERNHEEVSAQTQELFKRNYTLVQRVFTNRDIASLVKNQRLQLAKTDFDFRLELFRLGTEMNLAAMHEKYETYLKTIKVQYRRQFADDVTREREALGREITNRQVNFIELMTEKQKVYEQFKGTPAAEEFRAAMEAEISRYFAWVDEILFQFESIIREKIRTQEAV